MAAFAPRVVVAVAPTLPRPPRPSVAGTARFGVQTISFPVGSHSGWHSHPGPVFIQVAVGTMTFYDSDDPACTPIVVSAPNGFLDVGDHAHIARNESGAPAQNVVTYFAPPGEALRIDEPRPGNCPF